MEFVSFIRLKGKRGPVYIGQSADPHRLRDVLQAANPEDLELLGSVDARLYPLSWWEDALSPWLVRGSWYQPKAQVLCRVEDALTGRLEAPGRIDPLEDDPENDLPPDRVPEFVVLTREERARLKWAWPEVDPYPAVPSHSVPAVEAAPVLRIVLGKLNPRAA